MSTSTTAGPARVESSETVPLADEATTSARKSKFSDAANNQWLSRGRTDLSKESLRDHDLAVSREGDDGLRTSAEEDGKAVLLVGVGKGDLLTSLEGASGGEGKNREGLDREGRVGRGARGDELSKERSVSTTIGAKANEPGKPSSRPG